jgi:vitamin B12 transporter
MKVSRIALAVASLSAGYSFAAESVSQDRALKLEDSLITANRSVEQRSESTAASTVFTRADIERLQASDVLDLLRRVPGLSVQRSGGRGSLTGILLRGTSTAQTLVLIDGQRIASSSSGTSSLEHLGVEQIERVEVVRGGRSALYGSDAIGGVIQIFTRRGGEGLNPRLKVGYGSNGTWQRSLGLSGGNESTRFDLGASLDETAGDQRTDLPGSEDSAYRNKAFNLSLSHDFSEGLEGGVNLLRQSGQSEYDYSLSPAVPADTDFEVSSSSGFLQAQINPRWNSRLELGHSEDRQKTHDPYGGSVFNTYRDQANWLNTLDIGAGQQVLLGADWYEDRLHGSTTFTKDSRWNKAAFIQHRYSGDSFATELGLRHDKNEQYGSENTWNAAFTWHLDADNDLIASYSQAFRAPTFNDLYYPDDCYPGFGCTVYANPDLSPEKARSYEVQWRSRLTPTTSWEVSLYRTLIRDAIVTNNALDGNQAGSLSPYRPENIDKARINGLDATLRQELFGWQASLGYGLVDARNAGSGGNGGNRLARRPEHTLTLDIDRRLGDFNLGADWRVVNHSYDDLANDNEIPGYAVLGLRAGWQAHKDLRFDLKLDNLLDRDYYQARGTAYDASFTSVPYRYREEGRSALLSFTWTPHL